MGQQQLLLIILGVIVVGIAVVVGITMFQDNAISANRDAVTNDLVNLGARAQQFYRRPLALGGGGNTFDSLTTSNMGKLVSPVNAGNQWINPNGTYWIDNNSGTHVTVVGEGVEKIAGNPVRVECRVTADSIVTTIIR